MNQYIIFVLLLVFNPAKANIFPMENESLYYKSARNTMPFPSKVGSEHSVISFNRDDTVTSCESFDRKETILNTLKKHDKRLVTIDSFTINNISSELAASSLYQLSRINPNLFYLLNAKLREANDLYVEAKNYCQSRHDEKHNSGRTMLFNDWYKQSVLEAWEKKIHQANITKKGNKDIVEAKIDIENNQGGRGIRWIFNKNAGGTYQQDIYLIEDSVLAGYNLLLGRKLKDKKSISSENSPLATLWHTPELAIKWAHYVMGEIVISTCQARYCEKKITLGRGLRALFTHCQYPFQRTCIKSIKQHLEQLITGESAISKKDLEKLSTSHINFTPTIIYALKTLKKEQQELYIEIISNEIALARVIEQVSMMKTPLASKHTASCIIKQCICDETA